MDLDWSASVTREGEQQELTDIISGEEQERRSFLKKTRQSILCSDSMIKYEIDR